MVGRVGGVAEDASSLWWIEQHTLDKPFCGGVVAWRGDRLLFTLGKRKDWSPRDGAPIVPITWVGGGQEIGETVKECARREAVEELGADVTLEAATQTHWFYAGRPIEGLPLLDDPLPALVELYPSNGKPYKPGLPAGSHVWVVLYCAVVGEDLNPSDVPGVIALSADDLALVRSGIRVDAAIDRGIPIAFAEPPLPPSTILRLRGSGPEPILGKLLEAGELRPVRT